MMILPILFVSAEPLVPCGSKAHPKPCDFYDLLAMVDKVIDFLIKDLAMPLAAISFAYAGFLYLTSGANPSQRDQAKSIFWKVFVGLIIALAAWLIVKTVMMGLGYDTANFLYFWK